MGTSKLGSAAIWTMCGALALVFLAHPAASAPGIQNGDPLLQRVVLLEERTHFLQRQVDALQKQVSDLQRNTTTKTLEAGGWLDPYATDCTNPYLPERDGKRRVKPECAQVEPCKPPYALTSDGIKRINADCLDPTNAMSLCDPPYSVDAKGLKHYRPECFEGMQTR